MHKNGRLYLYSMKPTDVLYRLYFSKRRTKCRKKSMYNLENNRFVAHLGKLAWPVKFNGYGQTGDGVGSTCRAYCGSSSRAEASINSSEIAV